MTGAARIFLAMWLGILAPALPANAQAEDQATPDTVIADVKALLKPLTSASDVLWSATSGDMVSLGLTIPNLQAGPTGVVLAAKTLRDALWLNANGPVTVQPSMNGVTLGARLQIAGSPTATLWRLRADSNTIEVLMFLPQIALANLTSEEISSAPARQTPSANAPAAEPALTNQPCTLLTALSARIASGDKPRLTSYTYRTGDGIEFTTVEDGDAALIDQTTRVVDSRGFFQFGAARKALNEALASSGCQ
ncbi:MAG: hypothetical protein GXP05_00030 [Alphaproteobacteria bacterium]|nr:hypothetical protein [Alphaproteobacteria bacterium]